MFHTCRVLPQKGGHGTEPLGKDTKLPTSNHSAIQRINGRVPTEETNEDELTCEAYDREYGNDGKKNFTHNCVSMSANACGQMICSANALNTTNDKKNEFILERGHGENTYLHLKTSNRNWSHRNSRNYLKGRKIGELAERAILTAYTDTACLIRSSEKDSFGRNKYSFEREVDALHVNARNKREHIEIKCIGQLLMSKEYFFNMKLFQMVAKSIPSKDFATFIVQRDDRELNEKEDVMPLLGVQYCEDMGRLMSREDFNLMEKTERQILDRLSTSRNVIERVWLTSAGIKMTTNENRHFTIKCKAKIPETVPEKTNYKIHIVVGPNIPYYDFRNSSCYITYKYKFGTWSVHSGQKTIILLANSFEDLILICSSFKGYKDGRFQEQNLEITILTPRGLIKKQEDYLHNAFHKQDRIHPEVFEDFEHLGKILYRKKLTYWDGPIPQLLLLLGEGIFVPLCLITARTSWGLLTGNANKEFETGLDFKLCLIPDMIVIIGTIEECKGGIKLLKKHKMLVPKVFGFCPKAGIVEKVINYFNCRKIVTMLPSQLEETMKSEGIPMYKSFEFECGFWKAS